MDLKETFDRALDGGPAHRPIEDRLAVGRRATRRRRTAMGASVLATAVVLGGIGWALQPDTAVKTEGSVATSPTVATEDPPPVALMPRYQLEFETGRLKTSDGLEIQQTIDDVMKRPGLKSSASIATYEGKTWWLMAGARIGHSGWATSYPAIPNRTFEQWVHEQAILNTDHLLTDSGFFDPGWVTLAVDGVLTPHNGAVILEQTAPARRDQASDRGPSAAATIDVDGAIICVVARNYASGALETLFVPESEHQGCGAAVPAWDHEESAP